MSVSFKSRIQGNDCRWYEATQRFATREEASEHAFNLAQRWNANQYHAAKSDDAVNARLVDGVLIAIDAAQQVAA